MMLFNMIAELRWPGCFSAPWTANAISLKGKQAKIVDDVVCPPKDMATQVWGGDSLTARPARRRNA